MWHFFLFPLQYLKIYLFLAFFSFSSVYATIHRVESFDILREEVEKLNENSLVIFDVDNVILHPTDLILREAGESLRMKLKDKYFSHLDPASWIEVISRAYLKKEWATLIDPQLPSLIKELQKKHVRVIALTAVANQKFGHIPSITDWRIENLAYLNIQLHSSFPIAELTLNKKIFTKNSPFFKAGILFSKPYPKGMVLQAFLEDLQFRPERVIFIDDLIENIESVAAHLEQLNIPFLGLHYVGADLVSYPIDEKIAEIQFRYLFEKELWLSDVETKELLSQECSLLPQN